MTPLQELIQLNPCSVVLEVTMPEGYRPQDAEDYVPGAPVLFPMVGALSGVKVTGSDDFDAKLHIDAVDMPAAATIQNTRVVAQDGDYGLKRIRPRRLEGSVVGYTLELGL